MAEAKGKKALSLCILRVLERHASSEQPLTTRQIIALLEADYGMVAERKAVGRNLLLLAEMGFELSTYQDNGKGYYLKRTETDTNLRRKEVLLDALLRGKRSKTGYVLEGELQDGRVPIHSVPFGRSGLDESVFDRIEIIKEAIAEFKQLSFIYNNMGIDGKLTPQRQTPYMASPYALAMASGYYYVIMSISGYGKPLYYRCDLMSDIEISEAAARPVIELQDCEDGLDVAAFLRKNLYRQDEAETHVLLCARHLIGEIGEQFSAATMEPEGDAVRVSLEAPYATVREFVLKNLRHVAILAPEQRRNELKEELKTALALYPQNA
ncbi:MAG: WYL domain-containing protein [Clostridia bacterium]|nr:WYL domain-containing protein [Clostridia bacterium]